MIPRFARWVLSGGGPTIYGDGEQTRDFTYVANVIDANWKAATHPSAVREVFNIGCGHQTSLNQLLCEINKILGTQYKANYEPGRKGDVRMLDYRPKVTLQEGLKNIIQWYRNQI